MKTNSTDEHSDLNKFEITLSNKSRTHLLSISKWSRFLAVLGLLLVVGVLFTLLSGYLVFMDSNGEKELMLLALLPYGGLIFMLGYSFYYLFQFSKKVKKSMLELDEVELEQSFYFLNKHYYFLFLLLAMSIILYVIVLLIFGFTVWT